MRASNVAAIVGFAGTVVACTSGERDPRPAAATDVPRAEASSASAAAPTPAAMPVNPVPVAAYPTDACGWIPAAAVEATIGRFAEPPRPKGRGCLYTLPISPEVAAMRERLAENNRKIGIPERPWEGTPYGVLLTVDVAVDMGERMQRMMGGKLAEMLKDNDPAKSGWDAARLNGGRLGTISVTAAALTADVRVPRDSLVVLTGRVRDRITDLPFALPAGTSLDAKPAGGGDPCALVTREEAEAVLGALVVAPYRSAPGSALAHPNGGSCSYYSAKHHALVVTPHRSGGKHELELNRAIGQALDDMVRDSGAAAADTIEGTWDETGISRDGRLLLRKGERLVELEYETSSTNQAGALRLGKLAIGRLASER